MNFRNLLQKLDELKIGDINPATGNRVTGGMTDSEGNLVSSGTPGVYWNYKEEPVAQPAPVSTDDTGVVTSPVADPTKIVGQDLPPVEPEKVVCDIETQAKIKYMPSFNKAFAAARAAGCETFQWCGVYTTKVEQNGKPEIAAATGNTNIHAQMARRYANQIKNKYNGKPTPQQIDAELKALHAPNGPLYNQNPEANAAVDAAIKNVIATGNNPYNAQTGMIKR